MTDNIVEIPGAKEQLAQIRNEVIDVAKQLAQQVRKAYPPKRAFPVRDGKERLRRQEQEGARAMLLHATRMGAARIMAIISRPIPRPGTERVYPGYPAIVDESENPAFERLGYFDWSIKNPFTPFAKTTIISSPSASL